MADKDKTETTPTQGQAAEAPKAKLVKVRALMPFENPATKLVVIPGQCVEVTQEIAAELTKDFKGQYAFSGERYSVDGDVKRHPCKRAEIVQAAA